MTNQINTVITVLMAKFKIFFSKHVPIGEKFDDVKWYILGKWNYMGVVSRLPVNLNITDGNPIVNP